MPTAEIITIGTELLLGETADTNTRFIARELRNLGIDLFRTQVIGDNSSRIAESVQQALERAEIIITTGGLGPTVDDPTRQAIAKAAGLDLDFHPELWDQITARIVRYGRNPTENQKRQAYIPRNAVIIENPVGTAPAFIVEIPPRQKDNKTGGRVIISLPGVPGEMETLLIDAVLPYLKKHFDLNSVLIVHTLHLSGLGEGLIDDRIGDLETLNNPTVGLTAHSGVVDIRIAAKAGTETEASRMISGVNQELRKRLGDSIFGSEDETLEGVVLKELKKRGWTLACFEVNLEGELLRRFARTEDSIYLGGLSPASLAEELADRTGFVRKQFEASVAMGIAFSREGERQNVNIILITPNGQLEHNLDYGGHPRNAKRWAVNMGLDRLWRCAKETG